MTVDRAPMALPGLASLFPGLASYYQGLIAVEQAKDRLRRCLPPDQFDEALAEAHHRCPPGTVRVWRDGRVLTFVTAIDSVIEEWAFGCGRRAMDDFMASVADLTATLALPAEDIGRLTEGLLALGGAQRAEDQRARALRVRKQRNTGPAIGAYRLDGTRRRP